MGTVIELKREEQAGREGMAGLPGMRMERCRVLAAGEGFAVAETSLGALSCRVAASCLLRPEMGDLALVALPEASSETRGAAYVLAVLERAEAESPARLDLPSGALISAPGGQVQIEAAQGISLSTPAELSASAGSMTFTAGSVRWLAEAFSLVGKALELVTRRFTETAAERDTQAGTWTQRLGDSFRRVEDLDETQAGSVRTLARDTALLHGRVTYVQAEEFVKADGQEVHLG
ncbi:MAG: DUF3540 domain-containing protein [Desulfovibrio sp.]|jgi:hypothetical protein|nr:DUF3540 domain-containing protein [Desulfovibrio sp.]